MLRKILLYLLYFKLILAYNDRSGIKTVLGWKQISFDIDGVLYDRDSDTEKSLNGINFVEEVDEAEKYFVQYINVPIGFEVYGDRVFITVPRRRYGIPSTLNYVRLSSSRKSSSPRLKPYPDASSINKFVSVYRPRVDVCGRLWMVDTGLLEVPGNRRQIRKPAITVYNLETNKEVLRYELKDSDLVNERTPGGLTSITVDVTKDTCDDAYAYINDLATEGMVVFSMKKMDSWRIQHPSFLHDETALNFTVAGYAINWRDGLFSITLSDPDPRGRRTAYYHPMVSYQEYAIDTSFLKSNSLVGQNSLLGYRGPNTQSGCHGYHSASRTIFYANVAQDAILCWNVNTEMTPNNMVIAAQDHNKLVYIADLKVIDDEVWVLVNQMPIFVFDRLNVNSVNFYVHKIKVWDLIRGTACERS